MIGMNSSLNTGLAGIQNGMQQFQQSAEKIATMGAQKEGTDLAEVAEASVGMIQAENQVSASASIVKASDEIMGTLLDVMA